MSKIRIECLTCEARGLFEDCPKDYELTSVIDEITWYERDKILPEDDEPVLVTVEQADGERFTCVDRFNPDLGEFCSEASDNDKGLPGAFVVVAWAKRPEPWKG